MANKTNQAKCPVCGRFTSEKSIARYEASVIQEITALSAALKAEQDRSANLGKWLSEKQDKIEDLKYKLNDALGEIHYLRSRNWWQRLFNL